ncbi:substrate-binding domain-containing protein [Granulicoccus sp. GXG6511]|uniref:substrate-binding domain-containing protein n=1 Tax=Granulicoccus sp. GXG6511 TaxID=3381351 RepID=UPI003D7DE2F7
MPFRSYRVAAGLFVAALALTACQAPQPEELPTAPSPTMDEAAPCPPGDLLIETTTSDQPLLDAQSVDYSASCQNRARLTVGSARDGGTTSFVNGLVHIAGTDTPLDEESLRQAEVRCLRHPAWHLPVAADPIAIVYRIDGVDTLTLGPGTLAKVFSGVITHWNDPEILAANPGATLPDERIEVFFRSGRTGATRALGDYLNRAAPEAWPVGGTPSWRGAGQARGSAKEVFDAVGSTANGIGYVEQSQFPQPVATPTPSPSPTPTPSPADTESPGTVSSPGATARTATPTPEPDETTEPSLLRLLQDEPLALTADTAQRGVEALLPAGDGHDLVLPAPETAADAWPIARISYQVVCSAAPRSDLAPLERDWVTYLVADETQAELAESGRVALSPAVRERVRAAVDALS